jgi:hypothetical protein
MQTKPGGFGETQTVGYCMADTQNQQVASNQWVCGDGMHGKTSGFVENFPRAGCDMTFSNLALAHVLVSFFYFVCMNYVLLVKTDTIVLSRLTAMNGHFGWGTVTTWELKLRFVAVCACCRDRAIWCMVGWVI